MRKHPIYSWYSSARQRTPSDRNYHALPSTAAFLTFCCRRRRILSLIIAMMTYGVVSLVVILYMHLNICLL